MSNNKQSSVEFLTMQLIKNGIITYEDLKRAKSRHKKEIMYAYMKTLPIEDGVFTAIDKAHEYYNEIYGGNNGQQ